jgi:hypothetical protein
MLAVCFQRPAPGLVAAAASGVPRHPHHGRPGQGVGGIYPRGRDTSAIAPPQPYPDTFGMFLGWSAGLVEGVWLVATGGGSSGGAAGEGGQICAFFAARWLNRSIAK